MLTRSRRLAAPLAVAALAASASLLVLGPPAATAKKVPTITMSGATGSAPLLAALIKQYLRTYPGTVRFKLAQGGGEVGIQDVQAGKVSIGNASRNRMSSDPSDLVWYPIAKDSFCFDVNPANSLGNLTTAQAVAIWTGKVRDWSQVPGSNQSGTIDLIGRSSSSSLPPLVSSILLNGAKVSSLVQLDSSDGLVEQSVAQDKNAIGYNSGYYAAQRNVKAVGYNGVACTRRNAQSGQYPGVRTYSEVTKGPATGATLKFIRWIQRNNRAAKIINQIAIPL